jgi:hypothetical protein
LNGGWGIGHQGLGATIIGNSIVGAETGFITSDSNNGHGSLIANNLIEGSGSGVMIENDFNELYGNEILESSAGGIAIFGRNGLDATGNVIGGDTPGDENVIAFSGSHAIVIGGVEGSQNEVGRNSGAFNEGQFIRLFTYSPQFEPVGPNGGIKSPEIAHTTGVDAAGTAEPGAKVRVFRKESDEPGEIESFLGEDVANGNGEWEVAYDRTVAVGTLIAATQTNVEGGTSELSFAAIPGSPEEGPDGGGRGTGGGGNQADLTSPQTKIMRAPKRKIQGRHAQFRFSSTEPDSSFRCRLDGGRFRPCSSPVGYRHLKIGKHRFEVKAVDAAGNVDSTPVRVTFQVLAPRSRLPRL